MSWLLDTNVLSELRKHDRCDPGVRAWFDGASADELFTSILVIGEIRRAVESIRSRDVPSALALDQWLARIGESFQDRVLPVDMHVAERWGRLEGPGPIPTVDGLLAATALVHGHTLVTRNVRDVERTGVAYLDPFSG